MNAADLHVHTTNSDGTLSLSAVLEAAQSVNLEAVAVTDHDRLHPSLPSPMMSHDSLSIVHGVELRVDAGNERLDLLGYGVRRTNALVNELDRLQANRIERGRAIVAEVETMLDIDLSLDIGPGFGRPDIARAIDSHPETDYSFQEVFDELIGEDGPAYVARAVPEFDHGRALLEEACDLVSLAHPLRYDDPETALNRAARLDAVELHYPYPDDPDLTPVREAANRHSLVITGGSDAHDETVGSAGLNPDEWGRVRDRLST